MRNLICVFMTTALLGISTHALSNSFHCNVTSGVYKPVGTSGLEDASRRDSSTIGTNFIVERNSGAIRGNALFRNSRNQNEIVRNEERVYELLTRTRHADISLLKIEEFDRQWTFKYYVASIGLLLVGECRP